MPRWRHRDGELVLTVPGSGEDARLAGDAAWQPHDPDPGPDPDPGGLTRSGRTRAAPTAPTAPAVDPDGAE